ncbi:hypothetical protein PENTCL1PPCAC_1537 [Pristionchus entomophagus]|uniref:Uncharacterized protein n=1 Tax=Pristionchus entomophagus TaxID=358040 RepID=A0AAV5S8I9_9BILA|nr:hypothetical protein PENTCL1PPCAC_1537 [Pristionchus entomophagus]
MTANFSSFRFSMEVEIEKNLFTKFSESDEVLTFQRDRFKVIKRGIQTCLNNSKRKATFAATH